MARPAGGYKLKNGKKALGVTTIIGRFKETGGLLWWACEQGKAIERGEINSLYDKRDEAANAGTLAHDMVEADILGNSVESVLEQEKHPDIVIEQATTAYFAYRHWARQSKLEIIDTEVALVSEKYGFGGCIDAVGKFDNRLILLDWKSSKGVYVDHLLQLGGYIELWNENFPDNPITGGAHLVRFDKEQADFSHKYFANMDDARDIFLKLVPLYRGLAELKKRVK